jgi:hypothetical protein
MRVRDDDDEAEGETSYATNASTVVLVDGVSTVRERQVQSQQSVGAREFNTTGWYTGE